MQINNNGSPNSPRGISTDARNKAAEKGANADSQQASSAQASDSVALSGEAKVLQEAFNKGVDAASVVNYEKIERLKESIADGSYFENYDFKNLADNILDFEGRLTSS